ncbi:hypothetical protein [Bradyrhizobium erythrophlei]|uniref:Uncharacterized protein n=1 Tax=Bradyrhizobium erythrophlei TaxID=1437360 RepID=A0A1M7UHD0_9BRAD|nr:hypothetical protein [Bradyrhizobium erythrophlei]SHN82346.1 hypothetical protein SAMN05444170_5085 [Bradyrhizobium erythrophlei]
MPHDDGANVNYFVHELNAPKKVGHEAGEKRIIAAAAPPNDNIRLVFQERPKKLHQKFWGFLQIGGNDAVKRAARRGLLWKATS